MKMLVTIILALAAATAIGLISIDNPGLMIVSYGSQSWEMPLMLALLLIAVVFVLLYLLLGFIVGILRAPRKARAWNEQRQNKNAQDDTLRGYARLIEGDWERGEKYLVKRLGHSKTPMLNYLGAAYAAQQQQNFAKRDEYLELAEQADPRNRMAVDISRVRMLTQAGEFARARTLLDEMQELAPANKTILRLKADVCERTHDWDALGQLIPRLEKTGALTEDQLIAVEVAVREAGLSEALPDEGRTPTIGQYHALPGKRKQNPRVAAVYARQLIDEGELASAEAVLHKALKKRWSSELVKLYGLTRVENLPAQIAFAESWLTEHEEDPNVHLTLARLNLAFKQHTKARIHYVRAVELGAGDEAYLELGRLYEEDGNPRTALSYYRRGIEESLSHTSALPADIAEPEVLESVVTPGSGEIARPEKEQSEPVEAEQVRVIEHQA